MVLCYLDIKMEAVYEEETDEPLHFIADGGGENILKREGIWLQVF